LPRPTKNLPVGPVTGGKSNCQPIKAAQRLPFSFVQTADPILSR